MRDGGVYVADGVRKSVYVFDDSGNYLDAFAEGDLIGPEGLSFTPDSTLLIADKRRVLAAMWRPSTLREIYRSPRPSARIVSAARTSTATCWPRFRRIHRGYPYGSAVVYGGYFVEIEKIRSDAFPSWRRTYTSGTVSAIHRGLDQGNFYASERIVTERTVQEGQTEARVRTETTVPVRDWSSPAEGRIRRTSPRCWWWSGPPDRVLPLRNSHRRGIRGSGGWGRGRRCGSYPPDAFPPHSVGRLGPAWPRRPLRPADPQWRFDSALRLAVSSWREAPNARGGVRDHRRGQRSQLRGGVPGGACGYLRNNGVRFYAVIVGDEPPRGGILFRPDHGGSVLRVWNPPGWAPSEPISPLPPPEDTASGLQARRIPDSGEPTDGLRGSVPI